MSTKRLRGERWEYCIRRKGVLSKPVWLSFDSEAEGDAYCARIERLLDAGIVPEELQDRTHALTTIDTAHRYYAQANVLSASEQSYWPVLLSRYGTTRLSSVDYAWVERFVDTHKTTYQLAPSTIRHHVGNMARLWDWLLKKNAVATNPFRALRRGYATGARKDKERDRRISSEEIAQLIGVMDGDMLLLFLLALETAMRMREIYTITADQIDIKARTIFLDKTKNGDKRQVPLSSVALELIGTPEGYLLKSQYEDLRSLENTTNRISKRFTYYAEKIGASDLNFHDTRHEATCRIYERTNLSDLEIAKITGHKALKMLMRYANLRGSDLANALW